MKITLEASAAIQGAILTLVVLGFMLLSMALSGVSQTNVCRRTAEKMGYEYTWDAQIGCMIQVSENKWIPLESYVFKVEK